MLGRQELAACGKVTEPEVQAEGKKEGKLPFSDEPPSGPHRDLLPASRSTVSVSLGSPQITGPPAVCSSYHALGLYPLSLVLGRSGDTPQENTDSSATRLGPHANEGTGSSGRLMELCTLTPSRVRLHLFCRQPSRSGDTPQENTDSSATRLGPHANEGTGSSGRLMELCTLTPSRVRLHLFCRQPSRSGDTPQENTDSSATRLGPHANEGTGSSGRLMELCTLTPSRVRLHLFCRQPSRSGDTPQENTDSSATRLGPHANEGTGSSGRLMELCTLTPSRVRLHLFCRQPSRSGDTPQENTDSSATRLGPHANEGTGSSGRLMELCTLTPSRVRLHLFCRQPIPCQRGDREQWPLDGTLHPDTLTRAASPLLQTADFRWMSLLRAPTEIFCPLLVPLSPCPWDRLRSRYGDTTQEYNDSSATRLAPMPTRDREQWPLDGTLHPDTLTRAASPLLQTADLLDEPPSGPHRDLLPASRSTVSVSLGSPQITVDPETPHKKILILLQHVRPPCQRGDREQWPLDGTLHPDTLTRAASPLLQTAESGDTPQENTDSSATRPGPHANEGTGSSGRLMELCTLTPSRVRLHLFCRQPSRSGDTPQENTDSSATRLGPHANEGTGSSGRLMELCTLTPSRVRLHLFCRQPSRSGDTPQENTDSSATRLGPHANEGTGSSGRLMELCTLTPSRVRLHLFCRQPSRSGDTPQENTDSSATRLGPHANEGTGSSGRLMELCTLTPSRVRLHLFCRQPSRSGDTPQENTDSSATRLGPHANEGTGSSGRLMELCTLTPSRVRLHLFCRQPSRSGDTPQENTDSSATRPGPHANEGTGSSGRLMELCTLTPSRVRLHLFCRQPSRSGDTPQENTDSSATRLGPHANEGTGSSGRLMELCTLTPSRVRLHLFCRQPSRSGDTPQENTDSSATRLGPHANEGTGSSGRLMELCTLTPSRVRLHLFCRQPSRSGDTPQENTDSSATRLGPHANEGTGSSGRLMELCTLTPSRVRLHLFCRQPSRSGDTPQENTDSSATRLGPHANEGTGSSGRLMELCTLTPSRVRLHLFCRQPTSAVDEPPSGPHRDLLPASRSTVSVSLGSPQITGPPAVCSSYHALGLYPLSLVLGRSGDTPQENTDSSATRLGPHANEGTGSSGRLMELCTLTPSRVRLHLFCRQPSRSGDTPQENTDSSATRHGPHANEGTGSSGRLMELCTLTPSRVRLHLFCRQPSRSGDTPQENTDSSATRRGPHANEGTGSSGRLMELCTLTPSRVRLHLFCRQPSRSGDTPQENTDSSATRLGPHANEGTGSSGRLMELCTLTPSRVRLHLFCRQPSRSGDTPQENTDSSATRLRPQANERTGSSGRLMELCTLTPSRVRLHLFCRQPSRSGDTPQENTDSSATRLGPHANEGTGSSGRLMELCTLTPSRVRLHLFCRQPSRSGDTPQENTDSSATRLGPHANEGTGSSGRLMELCTLTPSRVRLHLFCRQPSRSGDTPQENTDSSATRLGPHANEGTGSSGRLMELCTLTPSRVRLHLFCRQP
ncbi:E3 Ubiquitin-Protein Ligase Msl2, partial [Manis pentadactyla]